VDKKKKGKIIRAVRKGRHWLSVFYNRSVLLGAILRRGKAREGFRMGKRLQSVDLAT